MGRYFILMALIVAIGFAGYQIYGLVVSYKILENEKMLVQEESQALIQENNRLAEEIAHLGKPENLITEIKSRFNYRFPWERTIIVAP